MRGAGQGGMEHDQRDGSSGRRPWTLRCWVVEKEDILKDGIDFQPLTSDRWDDLVRLFEGHGNPGYCWCTLWRLSSARYRGLESAHRREVLRDLVQGGTPTGIIGYLDGEPIGWCSVAPRETYPRLERSTSIARLEGRAVWSIVCFYLDRRFRRQDRTVELLRAAVAYATAQGAKIVEGYPVKPERDADGGWQPARSYRFMGYLSSF